jgi:hypothetical protein
MRTAGVIIAVSRSSENDDCGIARELTTAGRDLARLGNEASLDGLFATASAVLVVTGGTGGRGRTRRVSPLPLAD